MPEDYAKRDSELILPPGVFAFVLDQTKGKINTLCGPIKTSLSNTDQLVTYKDGRFYPATQLQAIQTNVMVSKGHYVILENPSHNGKQPEPGKLEDMPVSTLKMGQIENIPGPISFPLWPGQGATVVRGHHLRTNQYLLVRVYDDEAAKLNWDKSVVREVSSDAKLDIKKEDLMTGQLLVIKGTEIAFYIPPTGIEVLLDEDKNYVRDAVTLERLEYSILLDEDGNKSYIKGPAVVFPQPTQTFVVSSSGKRKFRAFELQTTTGIHIKVIADYTDEENGTQHIAGEELFITGAQKAIYFPRPEQAIISVGGRDKHSAIAIPAGEGRYVLDRHKGSVDLVRGPNMFLPNPINQIVVRRVLTDAEASLYYPGNGEVLMVNKALREEAKQQTFLKQEVEPVPMESNAWAPPSPQPPGVALQSVVADTLTRQQKFTPPRTITINNKYEGVVRIDVFSGYAIQVVNSSGVRTTVVGPQTVLLEYDEKLERLSLSKGKPKSADNRIQTVYLKHISNPVSDILLLKTHDLVDVEIQVKYLVRFDNAESDKWFAIDNYVQYMVDHLRSLIANAIRRVGVQEFYQNAADLLRDVVLGAKTTNEGRSLRHFDENGMTVYDLELIAIEVKNPHIAELLARSRQEALSDNIELERHSQRLLLTEGEEEAKRKTLKEIDATTRLNDSLNLLRDQRKAEADLAELEARQERTRVSLEIEALRLEAQRQVREQERIFAEAALEREIKRLIEEAKASETRMKAVQPGLVEALTAAANAGILEKVAPQMAALAFVNGRDLEDTLNTMLKGTGAEDFLANLKQLSRVKPRATTTIERLPEAITNGED